MQFLKSISIGSFVLATGLLSGCLETMQADLQQLTNPQQTALPTTGKDQSIKVAESLKVNSTPVNSKSTTLSSPTPGGVATVSYQELVRYHNDDNGDPRKAYGKTVQVAVTGKGEIGYFAKKSDYITFICKSGDKTLTANKAYRGGIQGVVSKSDPWEGATVYYLTACQVLK